MSNIRGMDPDRVADLLSRARAQLGGLDEAAASASRAARLSLSPLTYGVQPGGLLIAPAAIAGTQHAAARVQSARAEAASIIEAAFGDIDEQRTASAAGWSAPTAPVLTAPTQSPQSPESGSWWNTAKTGLEVLEVIEGVHSQIDFAHDLHWFARNVDGLPFAQMARAMPWKDTALPWLQNSGVANAVGVAGKALGVVGIGFGVADVVTGVMDNDPWKAGWGAFNVVVGIGSFLPPPAGPIIAGVGLVANAGKWVYENWDGITEFASNAADTVRLGVRAAETAVRHTVDVGRTVVDAVSNVISDQIDKMWPW